MRKLTLVLMLMCTLAGLASCNAKTIKKGTAMSKNISYPGDTAKVKLGESLSDVLYAPTKVNVYRLKVKERVGKDDVEVDDHVVRDKLLAVLSSEETAILQYVLLSDEDSYALDSIMVRSPFMPIIEFEFVKKKVTAQVVVSLLDRSWTVWYDDKRQFHFNYSNKKQVERFCRYFLNDNNKEE